ncbi:MAG: TrmB family transcriptional regulator [Planctomycetaceae bacterium]|nr:MAG: TrmB family transcriptional regulator [Planctomycetaceae bacterium]
MELLSHLNAVGFTEYEAKVYIALLSEYPATGYQLSKLAGIPRSMVYEALGRLDVRGAVLKTEEAKATLYRPMPPDALLDRLSGEHQQLMTTLRQGMNALYIARDEGYLWTLTGEATISSYAENMITNAQREAMLVLTDANLRRLRPVIVDADTRGVEIGTLLTGDEKLDIGQVSVHPPRESQLHKLADSLVVVVDEREVLIASSQPTSYTATVTSNTNMVQIGRQFVWMELFAHRIFSQLGPDTLARLSSVDRNVLNSVAGPFEDPT